MCIYMYIYNNRKIIENKKYKESESQKQIEEDAATTQTCNKQDRQFEGSHTRYPDRPAEVC